MFKGCKLFKSGGQEAELGCTGWSIWWMTSEVGITLALCVKKPDQVEVKNWEG